MVDLGTLGGATSFAVAVSNAGSVAGYADTAGGSTHAFSWTAAGGMVDLGTLGGSSSAATAVNNNGVVVGHADTAGGSYHAFRWAPGDATLTDLGGLGGAYSSAAAVNDGGQVVGSATDGAGMQHAASWTGGGVINLEPSRYSAAVAVNSGGQAAGYAYSDDFSSVHAFSWTGAAGVSDLGTLGGQSSYAFAVNDAGQVVGAANRADGAQHAFSWTSGAGMSDLGTLGGQFSGALQVNGAGQAVGYGGTAAGDQHAFSTDPDDGHVVDLGTLGGSFSTAVDVNAAGKVAGFAVTAGGSMHAVLFSPPTPFDRVQEIVAGLPANSPRFTAAAADLGEALNPSLWNAGGTALSYPNGSQFFDAVKQAVDQLNKLPNSPVAQKAMADIWALAEQLVGRSVPQSQLATAEARWSTGHTDALERLKQAWRTAGGAVQAGR